MTRVQQGVQNRYFMYDSLGRMIRVKQPEQEVNIALATTGNPDNNSWSAAFTYDVLGNVLTSTDAKGTVITNAYDRASRVTIRTYSNEPQGITTPSVSFFYDGKGLAQQQSPNYAKGKLTKVSSSVSTTEYLTFDNFGRLTRSRQITDGVVYGDDAYPMTYSYSLSGALIEQKYPSGRVVKNEFESDGDLAKVISQKAATDVFRPYVSSFSYGASGVVTSVRLGNGRWESTSFNSRLQPVQLGLGASIADTGHWKLNYEYGEQQTNGTVDAAKNNGNIAKQIQTVPGTNFVQTYKYDPLNRLTEAKETTSSVQNWLQNWTYDIYGNRSTFSQNIAGSTSAPNPTVDANTNRFVAGQGFVYDKNGNVVNDVDTVTSQTRTFVFNGDNKQTEVIRNGVTLGRYYYDGEGKRVKKVTDSETTFFVYSAGKLVAEYSNQLSSMPTVNYTTTDHLGSPRVVTDQFGQVKSRRDFMPFGEDIYANVGARTSALKYGSANDDVRQKFTGYQEDAETDLDFAEARMYENRHGRFTAIDPNLVSATLIIPQTWNRYIYVLNNPLILIDPTGEVVGDYYDKSGKWIMTDFEKDNKVYVIGSITNDADGTTRYDDVVDLTEKFGVTHSQFQIISQIVKKEGATDDTNEYLWIAHASNNRAAALSKTLFGLLMTSYSSVKKGEKTPLSIKDDSLRANAAHAGAIHVLTGGSDPSMGAQFWDGTDFLAWGRNQNKFSEYDSILIREDVFNNYLTAQGSNSTRYYGRTYALPAEVFDKNKNPQNWGNWTLDNVPESGFKYRPDNNKRGILYATGTAGKSIFWTPNYRWTN